jgi:hypothetical protein
MHLQVLGDSQTTHNIPTYAYGAYIGKEQDEVSAIYESSLELRVDVIKLVECAE